MSHVDAHDTAAESGFPTDPATTQTAAEELRGSTSADGAAPMSATDTRSDAAPGPSPAPPAGEGVIPPVSAELARRLALAFEYFDADIANLGVLLDLAGPKACAYLPALRRLAADVAVLLLRAEAGTEASGRASVTQPPGACSASPGVGDPAEPWRCRATFDDTPCPECGGIGIHGDEDLT